MTDQKQNNQRSIRYIKVALCSFFAIMVLSTIIFLQIFLALSANIRILEGESHYVNLRIPFIYVKGDDAGETIIMNGEPAPAEHSQVQFPINLEAVNSGSVNLQFSLFGYIPLRQVTINVLPEVEAMPGGHSIGIKLQSDGVLIVGFYEFNSRGSNVSPGRSDGIRLGDSIVAVEGEEVSDINHTSELLQEESQKGSISLTIRRNGSEEDVTITPRYSDEDDEYRIGLYIRDTTAGVGTLSFYEPDSLRYGALGHVIIDTDTRSPVDMSSGEIVKADIININAAQRGQPGEKTGVFMNEDDITGSINKNTPFGIFGKLQNISDFDSPYTDPLPIALASQVESGPATLLTVLEGETIQKFDLEIERVINQRAPSDKGLIIRITDEDLLQNTGGIVQGMSGSPIIQDDKLIGAITHVFVNDPRRGYGIFMEWMAYEAEIVP